VTSVAMSSRPTGNTRGALGGTAGVPHGVANTIVLPHALRFNQDAAADQLAEAAIVLDLAARQDGPGYAASRVVEEIDRLARDLELPRNLGDYGVRDEDVPGLARTAFDGGPVKNNPRPIDDPGQIEDFLRAIRPMPAVFDSSYVRRLSGENVKQGKSKRELAEQLREDIRSFGETHRCERMVMVWCGSTEVFLSAAEAHQSIEAFEAAGGARALLKQLEPLLDLKTMTVTGRTLGENLGGTAVADDEVIRPLARAVSALIDHLLACEERGGKAPRRLAMSARLVGGGSWRRTSTPTT
jgi:hypothetical protein